MANIEPEYFEELRLKYFIHSKKWSERTDDEKIFLANSIYHLDNISQNEVAKILHVKYNTLYSLLTPKTKEMAKLERSRQRSYIRRNIFEESNIVEVKEWKGRKYHKNVGGRWLSKRNQNAQCYRINYYVESVCFTCGVFIFRLDFKNKNQRYFCSKQCAAIGNRGLNNYGWSGGRKINHQGYITVNNPDHPKANNGKVKEHRIIVEKSIGRYLESTEIIHHIDCNKQNNDIINLLILNKSQHVNAHSSLEDCVAELMRIGVLVFNHQTLIYETCTRSKKCVV